jgi:hypothetical protein
MPPGALATLNDIIPAASMAKMLVALAAVLQNGAGSRRHFSKAALDILTCVANAEALAKTLNDNAEAAREKARLKAERNTREGQAGGLLQKAGKANKNMPQACAVFSAEKKPAFAEPTYNTCIRCKHVNLNLKLTDVQYATECSRSNQQFDRPEADRVPRTAVSLPHRQRASQN